MTVRQLPPRPPNRLSAWNMHPVENMSHPSSLIDWTSQLFCVIGAMKDVLSGRIRREVGIWGLRIKFRQDRKEKQEGMEVLVPLKSAESKQ